MNQKIINQQMFEILKVLNVSIQLSNMTQNKQTTPEEIVFR